jgi:cation diffusion facilitator family transporter
MDLIAAVIALLAVRAASVPPDKRHPFGHGKVENISGAVEALLIFLAAGWIIYEAVHKLLNPGPMEAVGWGVAVMLFSAILNIIVSTMLFRVGRQTQSIALLADAWHLRTDVYTSAGVMVALGVIAVGGWWLPGVNLQWLDPIAAIFVAMLILKAAWNLTAQSIHDLLDVSLPVEEQEWIEQLITSMRPAVCGFHKLRTRKAGPTRFIEIHLVVHPQMSVKESHGLAHRVADDIVRRFPDARVTAHVEPCDGRCNRPCPVTGAAPAE